MEALLILVAILGATSVHGQTTCSIEGAVRVQGLIGSNGGRVEVCLGGVWGTICDSAAWSQKNAQVACQQLPLGVLAYNSILPNTLPESAQATSSTPIHYSNVRCTGTEERVSDCPLSMDVSSCSHSNDVAIFCRTSRVERGDIRLLGDAMNGVGAVEIYEDVVAGWRTICPNSSVWDDVTATAACIQLGYESGTADNFSLPNVTVGIGSIGVDGITCEVDDYTLQECDVSFSDTPSCSAAADTYAGVRCQSSAQSDGSLRLFGADSTTEGRVEILYNGRWGAVCDDQWSDSDGEVACRQLGENDDFPDTNPFTRDYRDASEVKPIWLSGLTCDSTESSLMACTRDDRPIGFSSVCVDHTSDAALVCATPRTVELFTFAVVAIHSGNSQVAIGCGDPQVAICSVNLKVGGANLIIGICNLLGAEDSGAHGQHTTTSLLISVVVLFLHLVCQ